jgi:hypothetical protein
LVRQKATTPIRFPTEGTSIMPQLPLASPDIEAWAACQAGCPCRVFRFSAMAQVSDHIGSALGSPGALLVIALIAVFFAALIIVPAVWSRRSYRRKAALAVLERLIRWRA